MGDDQIFIVIVLLICVYDTEIALSQLLYRETVQSGNRQVTKSEL